MQQIDLIRERMEPINRMVITSLPLARARALAALDAIGVVRDEYPTVYAHCFSGGLRQMIIEDGIDGWRVVDGSDCLHLRDGSGLRIRFLKELSIGGLPPAGRNRSRIEAWSQSGLDLFGTPAPSSKLPLDGIELVVVWSDAAGRFACTAYQPLGPGSWPDGAKGKAIMKMPLGIEPEVFENMSFNGHAQEELLIPKTNTIVGALQRQSMDAETR